MTSAPVYVGSRPLAIAAPHTSSCSPNRLYEKGLIGDPVNKAKSVVFTEEGLKRAEELFRAMFTKPD